MLLENLSAVLGDFVLGGGTALALQIVHRQSFDFDFFTEKEVPRHLLEKIQREIVVTRVSRDTVNELTFYSDNIKITILFYPFEKVFKDIQIENKLKYFPLKTIAVQKAYTIGRRGVWRDYYDLFSILKSGFPSLKGIIQKATDFYGAVFNPKIFLEQLVYFGDINDFEIVPINKRGIIEPEKVKSFLEKEVKKYLSGF